MTLRCIGIVSPHGDSVDEYPGIHIGGEYVALEVYSDAETSYVRIIGDDGMDPGDLWDPSMFRTIDPRIPECWAMRVDEGKIHAAPASWHRIGFWSDYFEKKPEAIMEFERGKAATLVESTG